MRQPRRAGAARPPLLFACLSILIVAAFAACDGDSAPFATPTPVESSTPAPPTPAPSPTPAPADFDLGVQLEYEGEFERAIDVFAAVAASATGETQQAARLNQAQLLVRTRRFDEARVVLDAYLAAAPSSDASVARYMHASVLDDLGDSAGALDGYGRYIAAGGVLTEFARLESAKMLARLNRNAEAAAAAEAVMGSTLEPQFKRSFALSLARAYEDVGADASALAWYARTVAEGGDAATALARSGAIRKRLGDPAWVDEYLTVVRQYPANSATPELLAELDAAGVPVSDYERGLALYRNFENTPAREALMRAEAAGDRPAQAAYYIAAIDERFDNVDAAIAGYERSYNIDPNTAVADDALWWRGRLLEGAGRYAEADAVYQALVSQYPASEFATDAHFHRGLALYRAGDHAGAAFAWGAIAPRSTGEARARMLFWQARAEREAGSEHGDATLRRLIDEMPGNFYALRAEVLLEDNDDDVDEKEMSDAPPAWGEAAEQLTAATGVPHVSALHLPPDDPRWAVAGELNEAGLTGQADYLFAQIIGDAAEIDTATLFRTALRLSSEGRTPHAARAATRLIGMLENRNIEPPEDVLRAAYPTAYAGMTNAAAEEQDISPLLLLALVRQESYYDPNAGSVAGALGLTQVIEPTGVAIADDLGVIGFTVEDLFRPKLSLRFGASYLADQLAAFDGNIYHALAAYNGGPGAPANAIDTAGDDIDLFVEDLEFDETRLYVKLVTENYARYRHLYDELDRPSLPH